MGLKVLTIGTFGVPHIGHAAFLQRCAELGSLVVGVNSDEFVERYKGARPLYDEQERMALIESLGYEVKINRSAGRALIELVRPDILTIGTDWARRDYFAQIDVDQNFMDERGITMAYVPMRPAGISTTDLVRRSRGEHDGNHP